MEEEKDAVVHGDLEVGGDKKTTAENKVGDKGYFEDKFGNKIYVTDSKENQDRLAKLAKKVKKEEKPKKPTKRSYKRKKE